MNAKSAFNIVKATGGKFSEHKVLRLSAALAYYAIFSIGPLLAIVVGLVGLAFGNDAVRQQIHQALQGMLGENSAKMVDSMMAARSHGTSLVTTVIGTIALLFGAAGVFGQLQDSLNTIWEVKTKAGAGIGALIRDRFLSFAMVLGIGFLLLVSLALSTALAALTGTLNRLIPMGDLVAHIVDFLISFSVITLLFAMIFKFLPDVKIPWSKVWVGAIFTSALFALGKFLLGLYLGRQSTASAYGAAGSVIVILMWIYYASVILFLGAEFTEVYARATHAKITLAKYAEPVTEQERAREGIPSDKNRPQPVAQPAAPAATRCRSGPAHPLPATRTVSNEGSGLVWLMLATGLIAGALLRSRLARKLLKLYSKVA